MVRGAPVCTSHTACHVARFVTPPLLLLIVSVGLYRETLTASEWASKSERTLDDVCFYYPRMRMLRALRTVGVANDISVDYMRTRLGNRVRYVPDAALRFLYHKRAGEIFRVVKTP